MSTDILEEQDVLTEYDYVPEIEIELDEASAEFDLNFGYVVVLS